MLVYCVNDGAVMGAWAKDQGTEGSMLTMLGDPSRALTDALDMVRQSVGHVGRPAAVDKWPVHPL